VSRRRAPGWLVRAVATASCIVLAAGLTTATTLAPPVADAVAGPVPALPDDDLPAALWPWPRPEPPPEPLPEPAPSADCRHPTPYELCLGPPPGPREDARPAAVAAAGDRYAFLAGITDYRPPTQDTVGGADDVLVFRDLLLEAGWRPENVRILTDGQVTGRALRDGMAWLAERSAPGTFTLFHFSGHVKQLGGGTEALWPVDRDWVRDSEVTAALTRGRGRMWVDIAGCEAGSFLPGLPSDRVLVTASSRDVEKSYEYPEWRMSVWSGLVLRLGMREGQADADGDGRVTIGEALRYATYYAQVITWTQQPYGRQTPQVEGDPVRGWTLADPPA
jgi:hypothetical protein